MDNHRRNSIIEPSGGYGPDTRNPMNTTTLPPKPQQRAPADFNPRPQRPEFYQQGQYNTLNRPLGPQQQRQPPPQQQQQQQPRTPGDKVSPWNLIRQALPPDAVRGPAPPQQRPPPPSQYYNMQQRPPPAPQEQQQYRQQPPSLVQDRRPVPTRIEDRQPYKQENGRPTRPVSGSGGDDDEEVVVNSSVNQQPPPPPLNRRDSTLHAGSRPIEGAEPNRQWQRLAAAAAQGAGMYGKPQQDQPYGRQQPPLVIPEGQEQQRYNRQQLQQDEDARRPPPPNSQKPRDVPPMIRRDSVMDAIPKVTDVGLRGRNDVPTEYSRRPPPVDMQEDRRAAAEMGATRRLIPQDSQDEIRRQVEYKKAEVVNEFGSGGTIGKSVVSRPDVKKEDRSTTRDYEQQQQQQQSRYERKAEKELLVPKAAEHGNRASELRKSHFEATHMKPVKESQQYSRADGGGDVDSKTDGKTFSRELPPRAEEIGGKASDYAAVAASRPAGEYEPNDRNKMMMTTVTDNGRNRDEQLVTQTKNSRPDTLKIIQDNEPLRDSSNSKGHRVENDVGKSPSKIPKKDRSELKTPTRAVTPKSPESAISIGQKKLPMNKVQVGSAPSPNLKVVRSKIGSLQNTSHKPGGGQVKIENRKLEWKSGTRIVAKNDTYVPGGGDKKIQSVKLQWNAKPKVGSLENKTHKPGGGDKKIETVKLDFKDKAKPKIGSKDNIKHTPGGGAVKSQSTQLLETESHDIEDQKMEIKAQSKVGSWDNVKHRPGGGEVKIFDDKSYIKQTTGQIGTPTKSQLRRSSSLKSPINMKLFSPEERPKSQVKIVVTPTSEENLYTKIGTETGRGGFRRSANNRSPSLQNNIVIPEEAVRSKK